MPLLSLLLFSGCAFAVTAELTELRSEAKRIVESRHCFNCHSPSGQRPLTTAMSVYNLSREAWFSSMSDRQLREFKRRMLTYLTPDELKELGGNPNEKPLSQSREMVISKWVDSEIESRHPKSLREILSK